MGWHLLTVEQQTRRNRNGLCLAPSHNDVGTASLVLLFLCSCSGNMLPPVGQHADCPSHSFPGAPGPRFKIILLLAVLWVLYGRFAIFLLLLFRPLWCVCKEHPLESSQPTGRSPLHLCLFVYLETGFSVYSPNCPRTGWP